MKIANIHFIVTGVLVLLSLTLVFKSSKRMSLTIDEATHYFCGMQWWQDGQYTTWPENPVFSRIVIAAGPYWNGYRTSGFNPEGDDLTYWSHFLNAYQMGYFHDEGMEDHVFWIRIFVLPFFFISIILVWLWCYRLAGSFAAMIGTGVYSFTPLLMGHSGLATTDIIFMSSFTFLIWSFFRWLNKASLSNGIWFGLGLGMAMLSKYSVLPFFGIAMLVSFFLKWYLDGKVKIFPLKKWIMGWLYSGLMSVGVMILVIWAFYGFHVGPIGGEPVIKTLIVNGDLPEYYNRIIVPAPEWFAGLLILLEHNANGMKAYMFGEISFTGFWFFYPVGLTIKTPLPALLLGLIGIFGILQYFKKLNWEIAAAFFIPFTLMLSVMTSHINIGIRHISSVYPLFAVGATASALYWIDSLPEKWIKIGRYSLYAIMICQVLIALRAYPNYTNYFNAIAGKEPGKIMADSDLGWGQGLIELSEFSEANQIDTLQLSYFGLADECMYKLPYIKPLSTSGPVKGWIAISENNYWGIFDFNDDPNPAFKGHDGCPLLLFKIPEEDKPHTHYRWLDNYEPRAILANSIRMYYLE